MHSRVKIEVICGLYEEFINCLVEQEYYIASVNATEMGVTFICNAKDYKEISRLARKYQCRTKLLQRKGMYFAARKIFAGKNVAAAVSAVFIYVFLFSKLIWRIDVISPNQQINSDVYNLLYSNDIYAGALFSQDKNQDIIQQIFTDVDNVGYVTLNFYKGTLVCKVDPVQKKMQFLEDASTGNIIASQNGVVKDIRVYSGFSDVKVGQTVQKGDILVSAACIDINGTLHQVMPRAYVLADCVKKYTVQTPLEKQICVRTGEKTNNTVLKFMNIQINLKKENLNGYTAYDRERTFRYADVFGFRLPFTLERNTYYRKESVNVNRDIDTAYEISKDILDSIIENDLSLKKIESKEYSCTKGDKFITSQCMVFGEYDITK